ncbi:MAG TPA: DUF3341 domain-containing protein [Myxococcaceae bacterium]|nr:DUF3341 domain-containing protein [Myxococcaceae bacterium]
MSPTTRSFVAYFTREQDVLAATSAIRKAGLPIRDVYTPYAVHGLEAAMGLRRSRLSQVCFFAGLTGLTTMLLFAWWTSAVSWPLNVGGKPFASIPAFIPVTFEFTVLSAALITVAALFGVARLWPGKPAEAIPGATNDRFALVLEPGADDNRARALCFEHGAVETSWLEPALSGAPLAGLPEVRA